MNSSEAIAGLGINAGIHLLEILELNEKGDQMAGSEFTYIGLFLSGLTYKEKIDSTIDLVSMCITSIKPIHLQLNSPDAAIATALAKSALSDYWQAVQTWPSKVARESAAIALCQILAERLQKFVGLELTTFQKAKLRLQIAEQFEIFEIAYAEMDASQLLGGLQSLNNSAVSASRLAEIAKAKESLLDEFDDGEITVLEYHRGLNNLIKQELAIHVAMAECRGQQRSHWKKRNVVFAFVAALLLGFLIGPWLYPKLFGYRNAEECVLNTKHKYAVGACYDLYPSIQK